VTAPPRPSSASTCGLIGLRRSVLGRSSKPDAVKVRALDADSLAIERVLDDNRVGVCVVRLRGAGVIDYTPVFGRCGGCERLWGIECSTEDPSYAADPQPIDWSVEGETQRIEFRRPGALILVG
jgi:hypothetical protein